MQPIPPSPPPHTPLSALHLPHLLRILSHPPHSPYSLPLLSTLLAPLAFHNLHTLLRGEYTGPQRTAPGKLPWSRGRFARWAELASLRLATPAAPYSSRWVCLTGDYPGRPPTIGGPKGGDWALGVLDADGLLEDASQTHGLRFWCSYEHLLFTDPRAHLKGPALGEEVRARLGWVDGVGGGGGKGGARGGRGVSDEVWQETAGLRHAKGRAERWVYAMLRDVAWRVKGAEEGKGGDETETPHPRSLTDLPLHHLPYIQSLQTLSSARTAPYKIYWNPQILGIRKTVRLVLPEDVPWLAQSLDKATSSGGGVGKKQSKIPGDWWVDYPLTAEEPLPLSRSKEQLSIGPLRETDLEQVVQATGGRYSAEYLEKGLPFGSAVRRQGGGLRGWVTVRGDLSIMLPHLVPSQEKNSKRHTGEVVKALVMRTAKLLYASLRYTVLRDPPLTLPAPGAGKPPPPSTSSTQHPSQDIQEPPHPLLFPAADLLSNLPPQSLRLSALLPPSHPYTTLFTSLGFLPLTSALSSPSPSPSPSPSSFSSSDPTSPLPQPLALPPPSTPHNPGGYVDLALSWQRAKFRDGPLLEHSLGGPRWGEREANPFRPVAGVVPPRLGEQGLKAKGEGEEQWEGRLYAPSPSPSPPEHSKMEAEEDSPLLDEPSTPLAPKAEDPLPPSGDKPEEEELTDQDRLLVMRAAQAQRAKQREYDDGQRTFTFPVHQPIFEGGKGAGLMFPRQSKADKEEKKGRKKRVQGLTRR